MLRGVGQEGRVHRGGLGGRVVHVVGVGGRGA